MCSPGPRKVLLIKAGQFYISPLYFKIIQVQKVLSLFYFISTTETIITVDSFLDLGPL